MIMVLDFTRTEKPKYGQRMGCQCDKNGYANRYEIECDGLKVSQFEYARLYNAPLALRFCWKIENLMHPHR